MKITIGEWFYLPRLGKDVFAKLMSSRLKYEKGKGFFADEDTDLFVVVELLETALGEKVVLYASCAVDGSRTPCDECSYNDICDRRLMARQCLCDECYRSKEPFALYSSHFAGDSS